MKRPDPVLFLAIASFIDSHHEATPRRIADHFGLPIDHVIRVIDYLHVTEVAGLDQPYFVDFIIDRQDDDPDAPDVPPTGPDDFIAPQFPHQIKLHLTASEIFLALDIIDQLTKLLGPGEGRDSVLKLRENLAKAGAQLALTPAGGPVSPDASAQVLSCAWRAGGRFRMAFDYHRPRGGGEEVSRRIVAPLAVVTEDRTYLAGLIEGGELRWFRLDRMSRPQVLDEEIDATELARGRRALSKVRSVVPSEGSEAHLIVRRPARWIAESIPGARLEPRGENYDITLRATSTQWVRQVALWAGTDLVDIEPADLRRDVIDGARRMLQAGGSEG